VNRISDPPLALHGAENQVVQPEAGKAGLGALADEGKIRCLHAETDIASALPLRCPVEDSVRGPIPFLDRSGIPGISKTFTLS
jgi:hypothetical protein